MLGLRATLDLTTLASEALCPREIAVPDGLARTEPHFHGENEKSSPVLGAGKQPQQQCASKITTPVRVLGSIDPENTQGPQKGMRTHLTAVVSTSIAARSLPRAHFFGPTEPCPPVTLFSLTPRSSENNRFIRPEASVGPYAVRFSVAATLYPTEHNSRSLRAVTLSLLGSPPLTSSRKRA